jgi:hypothetical protein
VNVTFHIFGIRRADGCPEHLFAWCRDAESGLARARREARSFGREDDFAEYRSVSREDYLAAMLPEQ